MNDITPSMLITAYANGYFPMAPSADSADIHWFYPESRGILPLDDFHVPRSLTKFLKRKPFTYTTNRCFDEVIRACTQRKGDTWINQPIMDLYSALHRQGSVHSVECWQGDMLAGGLYGVALGGVFFGESMFTRSENASKAALVYLVELLKNAGYTLLDAQYVNDHLKQFGIVEISREDYLQRLERALEIKPEKCF